MVTREELELRLSKLQRMRAQGVRRIADGDRQIEYRTDAELAAAITDLERQISGLGRKRVSTIRFTYSKGT